jgi:hypothetical protein
MRRNAPACGLAAALALSLAGCSHHAAAAAVTAWADAGGTRVMLAIDPAIVGEANAVTVTISPAIRADDAPAALDLDMPDMAMRKLHVPLSRAADGSLRAGGVRFAMGGRWRAVMQGAGTPGGAATFAFEVRDN